MSALSLPFGDNPHHVSDPDHLPDVLDDRRLRIVAWEPAGVDW
jgi:hypothetical protein